MESVFAAQSRYEALRRQALEVPNPAGSQGLELGFIERQGLAAWLARGPASFAASTASLDSPTDPSAEAHLPHGDLVLVLTDLVMGDRQEERDGRPL